MTAPCQCDAPNADCKRFGFPMTGQRQWEICKGVNVSAENSEKMRAMGDAVATIPGPTLAARYRQIVPDVPASPATLNGHASTNGVSYAKDAKYLKVLKEPCMHRGEITYQGSCCSEQKRYCCNLFGECTVFPCANWETNCYQCQSYHTGTLNVGVIVGSYGLPGMIALNLAVIRDRCGDVPIIVVDDCSPGFQATPNPRSPFGRIQAACIKYNAALRPTGHERIGHAGGDMAIVWHGLQWAAGLQLDYVAKLSQRCIVDIPNWLSKEAKGLKRLGLPLGCRTCKEGNATFPLRSELMLFDVKLWNRPDVLSHLMPRKTNRIATEIVYWDDVRDRLGGHMWEWSLVGPDRCVKSPGVLWHCANGRDEYEALARKHGIEMGQYHLGWWGNEKDFLWG